MAWVSARARSPFAARVAARCAAHSASALYTRSHVHSVSRLSQTRWSPPSPQLPSGKASVARGSTAASASPSVAGVTPPPRAISRVTCSSQSGPSNHQWPKSSAS